MSSGDADFPPSEKLDASPSMRVGHGPDEAYGAGDDGPRTPPLNPVFAALAHMPPLSLLAALSALVWVSVNRLVLPLLVSNKVTPPTILLLIAPFALNLAACAGIVALTSGALALVRNPQLAVPARRLMIATLGALVVSTLAIATFLPEGHMSPQHVLVAAGALHMLVVQIAMTTLRAERSLAGRTTTFLLATSSLFALASMLLRHLQPLSQSPWASAGVASLHGLGELSFLLTPTAGAFVMLPWSEDNSARFARRTGMIFVCIMALLFSAAARIPDALYGHLLYSTLRLEWALERASLGYAIPISLAVGAAAGASVGRDVRHRQGGAALWLWMVGGYNPLTPARVLITALGAVLMCRAILTLGDTSVQPDAPSRAA